MFEDILEDRIGHLVMVRSARIKCFVLMLLEFFL